MGVEILVAGLGNILMMDDGIGIYLCRFIKEKKKGIEIQEFGLEDWRLFSIVSNFKKVVIVDAVDMGLFPGECTVWEDVDFVRETGFSTHNGNFASELFLARTIKKLPENIFLFGIQPERVDCGIGLTNVLDKNFDFIAGRLMTFIEFLERGEKHALH
ncbi:MAG: hydrogenase maturation protease [Candidatus Omnitrophica bacterium]|nr:hydrogenase maturation protease [Candidatus Omnitrophota bacterium]MCM8829250.1 hydrogenase maturation protease [Candidatus Omnitrophota bacterium]